MYRAATYCIAIALLRAAVTAGGFCTRNHGWSRRGRGMSAACSLGSARLRALGPVFGARLLAILHALRVERTAHNVVPHPR